MTDQTHRNDTTDQSRQPYKDGSVWMRGLMMVIFAFCLGVAKFVMFAVVVFQFASVLFTRHTNPKLLRFGQDLSRYQYQIMCFLTYNSEEQPFPVGEWPSDKS
ncbi:MAG: DUF4389 domain-containing protein [Motiliproteus sp.]